MQFSAASIALAIGLLLLLALLAIYAAGVGRRAHAPAPVEEVPTGNPSMERKVVVILGIMILSGLLLVAYGFWEPIRQARAAERQENVSIERGIELYTTLCMSCHGVDGLGAVVPGTDPPRVAPQLNRSDFQPKDPDEYKERYNFIYKTIQRGRPGTPMPPWGREDGGTLLNEQIHELTLMILKGDKHIQGGRTPTPSRGGVSGAAAQAVGNGGHEGETVWQHVTESAREKIAHGSPEPEKPEVQLAGDLSENARAGARIWQGKGGCVGCHVVGGVGGQSGPNLNQIGSVAAARKPGMSAEDYIRESIVNPNAYLVPGFPPIMPSFQGVLSEEELNQLVEYYMSLK